ncbi:hypothetical protein AALP_AA8G107300 [Arabis alpina]|uniref:RRM domain-containing protein n=1 Tax=Arabis alpina TaxID=50452 RepID=A0A087G684_ARAAL|nr:hypothetical protein AALP_AA8G107300 [Arabis alpina]
MQSLELNDSEAATLKSRICVEGYATSLPYDDVKSALMKLFSSCGDITNICLPRYVDPVAINRMSVSGYDTLLPNDDIKSVLMKHFSSCGVVHQVRYRTSKSLVYIRGEKDLTDKAQKLSGGCGCDDVEGCKIVVDNLLKTARVEDIKGPPGNPRIDVRGFDLSLPQKEIEEAVVNHFSSCGKITEAKLAKQHASESRVRVVIQGDGAVEKALKRSEYECVVLGCKLSAKKNCRISCHPPKRGLTGYTIPEWAAKRTKE